MMSIPGTIPLPQDYLVRIRYQTDLKAPECPPKFVDMGGAPESQLLEPSFVSIMIRADSTCVEIDPELGMPLDLVPVAGIFTGDDSGVRPYKPAPLIDPRDRLLFRTPAQLGSHSHSSINAAAASWLRRTEYISAELSRSTFRGKLASTAKSDRLLERNRANRTAALPHDSDPVRILAAILHGFDVANPETAFDSPVVVDEVSKAAERSWEKLRHPTKPHLSVVDTFPVLPDVAAQSDAGGYLVFKFATSPLPASDVRDARVDVGLLRPHRDTSKQSKPAEQSFDYYLPSTTAIATGIKRKLENLNGRDRNPREKFQYEYIRAYETKRHQQYDPDVIGEVAMTFYPGSEQKSKGVYYCPVVGRYVLQSKRRRMFLPGMPLQNEQMMREREGLGTEGPPDILNVTVRNLNQQEKKRRMSMGCT